MVLRALVALVGLGGEVYAFRRLQKTGNSAWASLAIVLATVVVVMGVWSATAEGWL